MAEGPLPGVNQPAWNLGHLASSAEIGVTLLGGEKVLPMEWVPLFGPGSKVSAFRSDYAPKEELLRAVEQGFERLSQTVTTATPEQLAKPTANPPHERGPAHGEGWCGFPADRASGRSSGITLDVASDDRAAASVLI